MRAYVVGAATPDFLHNANKMTPPTRSVGACRKSGNTSVAGLPEDVAAALFEQRTRYQARLYSHPDDAASASTLRHSRAEEAVARDPAHQVFWK
jgi:hypothetical protein